MITTYRRYRYIRLDANWFGANDISLNPPCRMIFSFWNKSGPTKSPLSDFAIATLMISNYIVGALGDNYLWVVSPNCNPSINYKVYICSSPLSEIRLFQPKTVNPVQQFA